VRAATHCLSHSVSGPAPRPNCQLAPKAAQPELRPPTCSPDNGPAAGSAASLISATRPALKQPFEVTGLRGETVQTGRTAFFGAPHGAFGSPRQRSWASLLSVLITIVVFGRWPPGRHPSWGALAELKPKLRAHLPPVGPRATCPAANKWFLLLRPKWETIIRAETKSKKADWLTGCWLARPMRMHARCTRPGASAKGARATTFAAREACRLQHALCACTMLVHYSPALCLCTKMGPQFAADGWKLETKWRPNSKACRPLARDTLPDGRWQAGSSPVAPGLSSVLHLAASLALGASMARPWLSSWPHAAQSGPIQSLWAAGFISFCTNGRLSSSPACIGARFGRPECKRGAGTGGDGPMRAKYSCHSWALLFGWRACCHDHNH